MKFKITESLYRRESEEKLEEMRTKEIKIDGKTVEAVLMAGGYGAKIYSVADGIVLSIGRKNHVLKENTPEYKKVIDYVNIKYQDVSKHEQIKKDFQDLVGGLK